MEFFNTDDMDMDPTEDGLPIVGIPCGIMSIERIHDVVLRYRIPLGYMYRIPSDGKYVSTPRPLKVSVCKESFQASCHIPIYTFIERLLSRYRLVLTQIHPNV